jgi:hypothetical protein
MSSGHEHGLVHRRHVISGGGGAVLGLMVATLGGTRPVRAEGVTGAVPVCCCSEDLIERLASAVQWNDVVSV